MDALCGDVVQEGLPEYVREDLKDVDRLRAIWALHRGPRSERETVRQESARRRARELGGGDALEALMAATGSAEMSGHPITPTYVMELARRIAEPAEGDTVRSPAQALGPEHAERLAEVATLSAHPVVRAAHTYLTCAEALRESQSHADADSPAWVLSWLLASLVLQRADFPPLLPPSSGAERVVRERLPETVHRFARLVNESLRAELSRASGREDRQHAAVSPLVSAVRRRILDHLRMRRDSVLLILRSLDPRARAAVDMGGSAEAASEDPGQGPTARCLITPDAAHWWSALELALGASSLTLYVVVQEVGHAGTGVLAVTVDAHLTTPEGVRDALLMHGADDVTVMPNDCVDDRWPQVRELVDEAISRAMDQLTRA